MKFAFNQEPKTLFFDKWLSETKFMENIDFTKPFKVMVDAPTGAGKTHYVVSYLKTNNIPFVFLTDTLLLMAQISENQSVSSYSAANRENFNANQLISVYNHIGKLCRGKVVVIDEAHSLITDMGFKAQVIDDILAFGDIVNQVIMLSGTPLTSKDEFYNNVQHIVCRKNTPNKFNLNWINTGSLDNQYETVIALANKVREDGKIPVISLLDTKDVLNNITELLKANGFSNVGWVNSITKDGELDVETSHYKELVSDATISADAIITTYTQGYNINNTNCALIFMAATNRHSYTAIAQMIARFRKEENLEAYMVAPYMKDDGRILGTAQEYKTLVTDRITKTAMDILREVKINSRTARAARKLLDLEEANAHLITTNLEVNHQMVAFQTITEVSNAMYGHIDNANKILRQYNISVNSYNTVTYTQKDIDMTIKEIDYQAVIEETFNRFEANMHPVTPMQWKVLDAKDELNGFQVSNEKAREILKEVFGNTKAYNKLIEGYSLRMSGEANIKRIRKAIYLAFKAGDYVTSKQVYDVVAEAVTSNGGVCNSQSKASEIFNHLFEADSVVRKVDGKNTRGFEIKSIK